MTATGDFMPTCAYDFDELDRAFPYPVKPSKPRLSRGDYGSNKEYHAAYAEAEDAYEAAMVVYADERVEYTRKLTENKKAFWDWALKESVIGDLPEVVLAKVREHAYEEGHSSGYSEIYNKLLNVEGMVLLAYKAGLEKR